MHKILTTQYIDPKSDYYNYWVKKSVIEGLDILMSNKSNVNMDSEDEIIDRIWKVVPWAFDQGDITAKREITSEVSSEQMNQRRKLSLTEKIARQKSGKRVDMAFLYDSYEIGVYEAKKSFREFTDEGIIDQQIKVPKILKGILMKLLTVAPTRLRQLETVGIITNGLSAKLLVMDCPKGYVCRIRKTDAVRYPSSKGLFIKSIMRCLRLIWSARLTMEKTVKTIIEEEDEEEFNNTLKLTPCFFTSENKIQRKGKRKIDEAHSNIV